MGTPESHHFHSSESAREIGRAALLPRSTQSQQPIWDAFVRLMRWMLPAGALVLGSITIGWPFLNDTEVSFNLSKEEVAPSDGKVRMTGLSYVGTDAVDRLFRVEAASGLQDDPGTPRIMLNDIRAEMNLSENLLATVRAAEGLYRMEESNLSLTGGIEIVADNGLSLKMDTAAVDLKTHIATGSGNIVGRAKLGMLEAREMTLDVNNSEGSFTGGVHMRITPKRPNTP